MPFTTNVALMNSLPGSRYIESACSSDTLSMYSIDGCSFAGTSPYADIVIAHSPVYGQCLFLDKEMQSAESDEAIYHEHLVHPVMAARDNISAKRVLIVGGGEGATAREVLKWPNWSVSAVDWVDIDGDLVDLCRRYLCWAEDSVYNDRRLRFFAEDICQYLERVEHKYDIIILDLPDPDILDLKESPGQMLLYSHRFFNLLMAHLKDGGAVVSHCGPITPGGDEKENRAGLAWIREAAQNCGLGTGFAYHAPIPSFQNTWGFWMSCGPHAHPRWPSGLVVMDTAAQECAFTWAPYWTSNWFGHIRRGEARHGLNTDADIIMQ
jgi:spermidine synthase